MKTDEQVARDVFEQYRDRIEGDLEAYDYCFPEDYDCLTRPVKTKLVEIINEELDLIDEDRLVSNSCCVGDLGWYTIYIKLKKIDLKKIDDLVISHFM